ncbi:uncharacterized protein LOC106157810 [Lingula anatina]|uniref:Uncharacterized protein LOC106157810 n=1 Tax=Lingula anatina TaxID=7574 RepID=A0A1S3HVC8_LINAN|nr:uncharacterized protein LOC106157810 [Lingula anatina]|eukprot:XP_013389014.1 uncharacterized protein LOC106157810 [Lingula anatina]
MNTTQINILVEMTPVLIKNLQVEDIIPDMVDREILSERDAEKVMAHKTEQDQAFEFLCILPKCGPRAFETFVEVLRKHDKKELADLLAEKATESSSKKQIASFYIKHLSQIQRLPWDPCDTMHIDDVYVNPQWVHDERKPAGTSSVPIQSYTSLFNDTEQGRTPKRILVRGIAGIGKTTFTQKMATDWANNTLGLKKCEVFSNLKYLLILNLRSILPHQTLKKAIEMQIPCSAEKGVIEDVMCALNDDCNNVLLVFDGYDEYDPNTSKEITDIIYRRRYQDVCTVITTRPWKAEKLMNRQIIDGVYEITGLTVDNIAEYVAKFFDDRETYGEYLKLKSDDEFYSASQEMLKSMGMGLVGYIMKKELMSLVKIPILLLFICLLWQEDQESDTKTDSLLASYTLLYKKLIQLLSRRRYGIRTQDEMEQSACVKNLEEQTFISLGKLAYDGLVKPDGGLIFDEKDLQTIPDVSELYRLGLLSQAMMFHNLDIKHEVKFLHRTFQEFFAAKYLAWTLDTDNSVLDLFLESLDTLDKLYDMNLVLRFLCGLSYSATPVVLNWATHVARKTIPVYSFPKQDFSESQLTFGFIIWCYGLCEEYCCVYLPRGKHFYPELTSWSEKLPKFVQLGKEGASVSVPVTSNPPHDPSSVGVVSQVVQTQYLSPPSSTEEEITQTTCTESTATSVDVVPSAAAIKTACHSFPRTSGVMAVFPAYKASGQHPPFIAVLVSIVFCEDKMTEHDGFAVNYYSWDMSDMEAQKAFFSKAAKDNPIPPGTSIEIGQAIQKSSEHLFKNHRNLTIISASPVKVQGGEITCKPCIVLYCRAKGVVPLGDPLFPKLIEGIPVDVREGFVSLSMHNSAPQTPENVHFGQNTTFYSNPLRMGCSIGLSKSIFTGTSGVFVQQEGTLCFLTCSHVLGIPPPAIEAEVCQPSDADVRTNNYNKQDMASKDKSKVCGVVKNVYFDNYGYKGKEYGIDAALIKVKHRDIHAIPAGLTPETLQNLNLSEDELSFNNAVCIEPRDNETNTVLNPNLVLYKCGKTGLTSGCVTFKDGTAFRTERIKFKTGQPGAFKDLVKVFPNVVEVCGVGGLFSNKGDSGAAVFLLKGPDGHKIPHVVGMVVAETDYHSTLMSPIWPICECFNIKLARIEEGMEYE